MRDDPSTVRVAGFPGRQTGNRTVTRRGVSQQCFTVILQSDFAE